jgi:hypothetical protein
MTLGTMRCHGVRQLLATGLRPRAPYRRDIMWLETCDAPIKPLLDSLEFSAGRRNWGNQLRFGLFRISERDMRTIAKAMGVTRLPD